MECIAFDPRLYSKKVTTEQLVVGDSLVNDIYFRNGVLIAKAGSTITPKLVKYLRKLGDRAVTIDLRQVYNIFIVASKKLFDKAVADQTIVIKEVEELVQPYVEQVDREPSIIRLLSQLQSQDEYTFQHTVNIGVLSIAIGKWLGLEDEQLKNLILAGTLHDIGKSKIPVDLINKPGSLTEDEYSLVKKHTVYGYELLEKSSEYDEKVKLAVLQHHERMDGTGYPHNIKGEQIHLYSKIVAVADVYHALTSRRAYKPKVTPLMALDELDKSIDRLDAQVVLVFIEKMLSSLQSGQAVLNNGEVCDIIHIDRQNITKPLVKIKETNEMIDLNKRDDLYIADMIYAED